MLNELMKKRKNNKGFTLIELIVVIAILAILATILVPRFVGFTDKAKINKVASDCKTISKAIATYYAENGTWPTVGLLVPDYLPATPAGMTLDAANDGAFSLPKDANSLSAYCNEAGNIVIVHQTDAADTVAVRADLGILTESGKNNAAGTGDVVYLSKLH